MPLETTEQGQGPSGAIVEKTVEITTPNKTLDSLTGKTAVEESTSATQSESEQASAGEGHETGGNETENNKDGGSPLVENKEGSEDTTGGEQTDTNNSDELDLSEILIDIDGKDYVVADLIEERNELAKRVAEIEKDEFLKGFVNHYLTTGNANAYLEAKGVDWDKKDDLDVLRNQFDRDYADLDPKVREKLWRRELADKYKIKPDLTQEEMESEDYEIAQGLLKRDAKKIRDQFKETQKKFQVVDRKVEEKAPPKFDPAAYKQQLLAEKEVSDFMKNKLLKLGVKGEDGNHYGYEPTNPEQIIEMMVDDRKFWGTFVNGKTIDRNKQAKIYAYANNPDEYEKQLVEFGKTLALEERLKEVKNTDDRLNKKTTDAQTKETNWKKGFLTAALQQKTQKH
jgi:hypothetical protein